MRKVKNLAFEGGGVKGYAYVSAFETLLQYVPFGQLKRFAGSSAGAIFAFLVVIGHDPSDLKRIMVNLNLRELRGRSFILKRLLHAVTRLGLFSTKRFHRWLADRLEDKLYRRDITFQELYQCTGRKLYVTGSNVEGRSVTIFGPETTPTYSVIQAVVHSMSFPFYFQPKGSLVDGGLGMNYPIKLFDQYAPKEETLGFRVDSSEEIKVNHDGWNNQEVKLKTGKIGRFISFVGGILNFLVDMLNKTHLDQDDYRRTVFIDTKHVKTLDFNLSEEDQALLLQQGYRGMEKYAWKQGFPKSGIRYPDSA